MIIGIAYDKRDDYSLTSDAGYFDFTTAAELSYVKQTLEKCGHAVKLLGNYYHILKNIASDMFNEVDLVFNMSEGLKSRNREGSVPVLLEMAKIPYTGTDAYGLGLCLNKYHSKIMAEYLDIPTPEFCLVRTKDDIQKNMPARFPCVLKPIYEGTSSGIKLVKSNNEYISEVADLLDTFQQPVLCEKYIDGREFTVSLIGTGVDTNVVGIVETLRKDGTPIGIFSSKDKMYGNCKRTLVQNMPKQVKGLAFDQAIKFHNFVECKDLNRIDYRMDGDGNLFFLEANPLPGLSMSSAFPNCCILNGISFENAMEKIIESALKRYV